MILIDAVAGCESHNMHFWVSRGMADTRDDTDELCALVRNILDDDNKLKKMRDKLADDFSKSSSEKIFEFIKNNAR